MTTLSVDADIPAGTDLLGKSVTDLQENIVIGNGSITGTLKHVTGYTGFSGDPTEQEGNYLVLHFEGDADSISVELVGGLHGPVTLDEDGIIILRIINNNEVVKVTARKAGELDKISEYYLTDLVLAEE